MSRWHCKWSLKLSGGGCGIRTHGRWWKHRLADLQSGALNRSANPPMEKQRPAVLVLRLEPAGLLLLTTSINIMQYCIGLVKSSYAILHIF